MVFRTAYRITGNAADAEDVLQTVFLRLMRRGAGSGPMEKQESYLRRAAVNVAIDVVRSGKDSKAIPIDEAPPGPRLSTNQMPEAESRELRAQLRRAIAQLPSRDAEVFALRFFEDRSNQEIARMLSISQVHVAVILHRSRKQLQNEIRSYMGERI